MIRKPKKPQRVDAILTADWHLRESVPKCRTDDFWAAQWRKVSAIRELQEKYGCPVYHSGDLFDHWKPSPYLLSETMKYLPEHFNTCLGNHDLPQHSIELYNKSGVYTLLTAGVLMIVGDHWGQELSIQYPFSLSELGIWHVMTYQGKAPWPGCTDLSARQILEKYPQFDLILTGHNHKTFVEEMDGRLLVNPGSLTRQSADQEFHMPCVFLWDAEKNTVQPYYLPCERDVVSREHLEVQEQRESRISAFVEKLDGEWKAGIRFEDNMERAMAANEIKEPVKQIVWRAME